MTKLYSGVWDEKATLLKRYSPHFTAKVGFKGSSVSMIWRVNPSQNMILR